MPETVRILHLTTHDEECGIAKYQEQYLRGMRDVKDIENVIFEYSPNQTKIMTSEEFAPVLKQFSKQLKAFDILHVQHEFSFYKHDELDKFVSEAAKQGKKIIMTVHTSPDAGLPKLGPGGFGPRSILHGLRAKRLERRFNMTHLRPMRKADLLIVHNGVTLKGLVKRGINRDKIIKITMPIPKVSFDLRTTEISDHLDKKDGDVIYCTVGFLSENKGMKHAVQALAFLPDNYKLAIIGGGHPSGENDKFYDKLCDTIRDLNLKSRAYITGYVKDDERLNALIRECDICVYPYNKEYYNGVTSAALNNSIANYKPAIAYPTDSIIEMNEEQDVVKLCDSFNYYELAREILGVDIKKQQELSKKYAEAFGYGKEAAKFSDIYRQLMN